MRVYVGYLLVFTFEGVCRVFTFEGVRRAWGPEPGGGQGGGWRPPPDFGGKFFNRVRPQIFSGFVVKFLTL